MSSRIRFATARGVFEAFDDLRHGAPPPADECAPLDYVSQLLASRRPTDALTFLAYLLPRREAIWWAHQCVAAILGPRANTTALRAAEDWVRAPDEERRHAALEIGKAGDQRVATTWLALAAGWSGGSLIGAEHTPVLPPPSSCAKAVNAAVVLAVCTVDQRTMPAWISACVEAGIRFADGEEAKVIAPKPAAAVRSTAPSPHKP
jgi:hypothetical protein